MAEREYHYVITIQHQQGLAAGSIGMATTDGTITAREGATRQELYSFAYDKVRELAGLEGHVSVMHFSLGRNDLTEATDG